VIKRPGSVTCADLLRESEGAALKFSERQGLEVKRLFFEATRIDIFLGCSRAASRIGKLMLLTLT
jgi:hypothetical protein